MRRSFTELRQEILKNIKESEKPISVKDIHARLESKPNLSTVYRALDYLCSKGFVKSISFASDGSYYFSAENAHSHFVYCKECSEIKVFEKCFAEEIQDQIEDKFDYKITDHFFYFAGICDSCRHNPSIV